MQTTNPTVALLRGIVGGFIGGAVGYFLFQWLLDQGYYALAIPGAFVGIGCAILSRVQSTLLGALCAVAGIALAVFLEWHNYPFKDDPSLSFFVRNVHELPGPKQLMILLSGVFAFWFGRGTRRLYQPKPERDTPA